MEAKSTARVICNEVCDEKCTRQPWQVTTYSTYLLLQKGFLAGEKQGYKAGIIEVVEFVDTHKLHGGNISIPKFLWQAFKESRGITNP